MASVVPIVVLRMEAKGTKGCKAIPRRGLDFGNVVVGAGVIITFLPLVSLCVATKAGARLPSKGTVQGHPRRVNGNSTLRLRGEGGYAAGSGSDAGGSRSSSIRSVGHDFISSNLANEGNVVGMKRNFSRGRNKPGSGIDGT